MIQKAMRRMLSRLSMQQQKQLYFYLQRQVDLLDQPELDRFNTASILNLLRLKGLSAGTVIDIGAYEGLWTAAIARVFPGACFHLFEPQAAKQPVIRQNLGNLHYHLHQVLLGDEPGVEQTFYEMESGSSVMKELSNQPYRETRLTSTTLDEVLSKEILKSPIILKLDVQGFEAAVLQGARRLLDQTELVILELSFLDYNENAPLAAEMIGLMDKLGFLIFDFGGFLRNGNDRSLIQADVIFIRKDSPIRQQCNDFRKPFTVYHTH